MSQTTMHENGRRADESDKYFVLQTKLQKMLHTHTHAFLLHNHNASATYYSTQAWKITAHAPILTTPLTNTGTQALLLLKAHFHPRRNAIVCYCFESRIAHSDWPTIFVEKKKHDH